MNSLGLVGKLGFGITIVLFGVYHFMNVSELVNIIPNHFPVPKAFVYGTGAALIAAGISVIIGKKSQLAMLLLGIMFLLFALLIDFPRGVEGRLDMLKGIAMACASWFISSQLDD